MAVDREAMVRMVMTQAEHYYRSVQAGWVHGSGALLGLRACLLFMGADAEAGRVGEMLAELTAPPRGENGSAQNETKNNQ